MMETSIVRPKNTLVCTHLTETPTDQPRDFSNDRKSLAQLEIVIEVGKAVLFVPFSFYKLLTCQIIFLFTILLSSEVRKLTHATLTNQSMKCRARYLSNLQTPGLF